MAADKRMKNVMQVFSRKAINSCSGRSSGA